MTVHILPKFITSITDYRYFSYSQFKDVLSNLHDHFGKESFEFKQIGQSVLKEPIYGLELGTGEAKILMWSQMHGNESTTTRSLLIFMNWFLQSSFQSNFRLYIIPVLNPDGLTRWTRENANGVDLNRDAQDLTQPESKILRTVFEKFQPDYCFNLHDQRTIYGIANGVEAAQCSFLAPAANSERSVTDSRLKAMNIINQMVKAIQSDVNGVIGRYNDTFNINCVGDTFQSLKIPTILFEAGQSDQDYYRIHTKDIIYNSLITALNTIRDGVSQERSQIIDDYESIPSIKQNYTDILIKNVPSGNSLVSLSIMYRELVEEDILYFVPFLSGVNERTVDNAHRVIDWDDYKGESIDFELSIGQRFISDLLDIRIFY